MLLRYQYATECDVKALYEVYIDPEYKAFFRNYPRFLNKPQFIQAQARLGSLLSIWEGPTRIGFLVVNNFPITGMSDVSLLLYQGKQKQGYAPEIMKEIVDILLKSDTRKVVCHVLESDTRLNAMLEKGGFTKECVIPDSCKVGDTYHGEVRWSMKKEQL